MSKNNYKEWDLQFGIRLEEIMLAKKVTNAELSRRTNIPYHMISAYKFGHYTPTAPRVAELAKALGVEIKELMVFE